MPQEHFRNDYFVVTEPEPGVVRIHRTEAAFESIHQLDEAMRELNARLTELDRAGMRVLVDTRAAPPRNDADFEQAFDPHRKRMLSGFERQAVLVRTEAGRMQVQRHAEQDHLETRGFRDEARALAWLRE